MYASFEQARTAMIDGQIRPNRVCAEHVIEAFKAVPKEDFVAKEIENLAYTDETLSMHCRECILKPYIHARMLQEADLRGDEFVLDIGCSSGYSAAILAHICGTVVGVTHDETCMKKANETLNAMNLDNVIIVQNDLNKGYAQQAPYDFIFIEGLVEELSQDLFNQLSEKGKLMTIVRNDQGLGECTLFIRNGDHFSKRILFEVEAPLLEGFEKTKTFQF